MILSRTLSAAALAGVMCLVVVASLTSAHMGASAYIIVPADHVVPGEGFDVVGSDMTPGLPVAFRIVHEPVSGVPVAAELATISAGTDGHFRGTLSLPAAFPGGYARLFATATDGTEVSTYVLVGARTASTPSPPGQSAWWTDTSVIVLIVFVVGTLGVLGYLAVRRARCRACDPPRVWP